MNTHGHENIANTAGLPLLKEAFERLGYGDKLRFGAFYLGNWITDLSQLVDPGAIVNLRAKLENTVNDLFDSLLTLVKVDTPNGLLPLEYILDATQAQTVLKARRRELLAACTSFEKLFNEKDKQKNQSLLYKLVQAVALLTAYFKFVHPEGTGKAPRMDLDSFTYVFDELFIQYFPHEHLDRPQLPDPHPDSPSTPTRQPRYDDRKPDQPGLYTYLSDDVEAVAGLMCEVENWAETFCHPGVDSSLDKDKAWNLGLAKFGHALHGIEDFFAHSNFVEHAALMLGEEYLKKHYVPYKDRRFQKRLKRYDPDSVDESDWTKHAAEIHVVTGYFDFLDTFVSLFHLFEGLILGDTGVEKSSAPSTGLAEAAKQLESAVTAPERGKLENNDLVKLLKRVTQHVPVVEDMADVWKAASDMAENEFPLLMDGTDVTSLLEAMPIMRNLPDHPVLTRRLVEAVLDLLMILRFGVKEGVAGVKLLWHALGLLWSLAELILNPAYWLEQQMMGTRNNAISQGLGSCLKPAVSFAEERLFTLLGLDRVGSHSLLAKDHGREPLSGKATECAMAVHYVVVQTMMRRSAPNYVTPAAGANRINWSEFLKFYLRHPVLQATADSASLAFLCTYHELTDNLMNWEQVLKKLQADPTLQMSNTNVPDLVKLNYETQCVGLHQSVDPGRQLQMNATQQQSVSGIVIPRYAMVITQRPPEFPQWFLDVLKQTWEVVKTRQYYAPTFYLDQEKAKDAVTAGSTLRKRLEEQYNNNWRRPAPNP